MWVVGVLRASFSRAANSARPQAHSRLYQVLGMYGNGENPCSMGEVGFSGSPGDPGKIQTVILGLAQVDCWLPALR